MQRERCAVNVSFHVAKNLTLFSRNIADAAARIQQLNVSVQRQYAQNFFLACMSKSALRGVRWIGLLDKV